MEIWKHYSGYSEAREKVRRQTLEEDLELLDSLFGRSNLQYGATPEAVKEETFRQLEVEWRSERDETAEFHVELIRLQRGSY